jgi:phosphoglycerate dehydrogenase-like enzyme
VIDRMDGTFDHRAYRPLLLQGKTLCVIGAGGIGREVGRLGAALGMRVVGTRRSVSAESPLPEGFVALGDAGTLDSFLAEADFVAICCQWTEETTNLINAARLAMMKPGVVLVNVARGEIIDEAALVDALAQGRLRGVVLDVYVGEFERKPPDVLWRDPRVLITPHVSGASDESRHGGIELFCENMRAWLGGRELRNVIDWDRGY